MSLAQRSLSLSGLRPCCALPSVSSCGFSVSSSSLCSPLSALLGSIPACLPGGFSFTVPSRGVGNRYVRPSRSAPAAAPPVVFKQSRPTFDPLAASSAPAAAPQLEGYWPDGFVPSLVRPLPWLRASPPSFSPAPFTRRSVRCGVLGRKVGMMPAWDRHGVRHALTVIEVESEVIRINRRLQGGRLGIVLGIGRRKLKRVSKALMVQSKAAGVHPPAAQHEFRVTPDALLPVGHVMSALHFLPGQHVDVTGVTVGYGFAGAMRRHHFAGQPASHGVSVSHRSLGSTGAVQDPGRVWKGKKMAGRLGGERDTQLNLVLYRIDPLRNLLYVRGAVPGSVGGLLRVRDAVKKSWEKEGRVPPFPSVALSGAEDESRPLTMDVGDRDPFAYGGS